MTVKDKQRNINEYSCIHWRYIEERTNACWNGLFIVSRQRAFN